MNWDQSWSCPQLDSVHGIDVDCLTKPSDNSLSGGSPSSPAAATSSYLETPQSFTSWENLAPSNYSWTESCFTSIMDPAYDYNTTAHMSMKQALLDQYQSPTNEFSRVPKRALSRTSSMESLQSRQGRSRVRLSSIHSRASSQGEFVFEANPERSQSRNSGVSGRRGPLDLISKAAMNAVKKVGACWRCRILRKTVSERTSHFYVYY